MKSVSFSTLTFLRDIPLKIYLAIFIYLALIHCSSEGL